SLELGRGNMLFARSGGRVNATPPVGADDDDHGPQRAPPRPEAQPHVARVPPPRTGAGLPGDPRLTSVERWCLPPIPDRRQVKHEATRVGLRGISPDLMRSLKRAGFGDWQLGSMLGADEDAVRAARADHGLKPAYKRIDTCAAEFESFTPYLYGTYERECEADPTP